MKTEDNPKETPQMRKILIYILSFIFLILGSENILNAQLFPIDKGSINTGGDIGISSFGGDLYNSGGRLTNVTAKPYYSYFIREQFSVGGKLFVSRTAQGDLSQSSWAAGPSIKYFFGETMPKRETGGTIYFFLQATLCFKQSVVENADSTTVYSGTMIESGTGFCYMITNSVGYITEIDFQFERMQAKKEVIYGNGLLFNFGFTFFFY